MKKITGITAYICLSTIVVFIGLEVGVRVLDIPPRPLRPLPINMYQLSEDPILGYEFIPSYSTSAAPFTASHRGYKINSEGFRDYEYSVKKKKGVKRIIFLGDSTTAGNAVPQMENVYPKVLERKLNYKYAQNTIYEVFNMGVGGYQTLQEVETLKVKGLKYKPDLVILCYCLNDQSIYAESSRFKMLWERNENLNRGEFYSFSNSILKKSRLAFILHHYISLIVDKKGASKTKSNSQGSYDWYKENILKGKNPMVLGLQMFSELQKEHGFRAVVVILPSFLNHFDNYQSLGWHAGVHQMAEKLPNIEVIDLLPYFRHVNNDGFAFSPDGCHLNEYGHRIMAEMLESILKEKLRFLD